MGRAIIRLIVPSLLITLVLSAAEQPPLIGVTIGDGARLIQRWDASLYAKLWSERSLEALRTKVADALAGAEGNLGFKLIDALAAMKSGDVRITGLIPPSEKADTDAPDQLKARLLAQVDLGAFATRVMDLMSAGNTNAETLTLAGADVALRPATTGNPAIEHMTFARFGERLLFDVNREQPLAPYVVMPGDADVRFTIDYRGFLTAMSECAADPKQRATFASMRSFDQYLEPLMWEMTLVPEGIHERLAQKITYPGTLPVDRTVFAHLPANTLLGVAMGFDSKAYWTAFEPVALKMAADQGTTLTPAQLHMQIEQGFADLGLTLTADQVVGSVTGTVLVAVTPSAPFPAVTIAIPRSAALDQIVHFFLSAHLKVDAPADGASAPLPIPNLPLPITLIADAKYWVVTSDQTLGTSWFTGGANSWSTSPALKTALTHAAPDAFLIGASDTPALLRTLGGFLPLMPIQDAKDKQTLTIMLARASAAATTGFLIGQHQNGGWEMEARGLLGMGMMPAILAGVALPALGKARSAASDVGVVSVLRSGVFPAQIQFQAGAYIDQNGDNIGEYGFLSEMSGGAISGQPETLKLTLLPEAWNAAHPTVQGYRFACWLPDGTGGAVGGSDGLRVQNAAAAKAQSEHFVVYAWSPNDAGKPVYALTQAGTVYSQANVPLGADGPAWNALFGGASWETEPVWEPQRRR